MAGGAGALCSRSRTRRRGGSRVNRKMLNVFLPCFALLCVGVVAVGTAQPSTASNSPSSRSAGPRGTLALYTWLSQLGFRVDRISGGFDLSGHNVVVIDEPTTALSDDDVKSLLRFRAAGGDVILAVDDASSFQEAALLEALHLNASPARAGKQATLVQPLDAGDRVRRVPLGPDAVSFDDAPEVAPLLADAGAVVAVATGGRNNEGRAYVLGSSRPLSNDGLRRDDSAGFVLSLLQRARGGAIGFDEYHHGEANSPGAGAIFAGPVGAAIALGALVVMIYLALSGRRLGKAVPRAAAIAVPSASEYVTSMGQLFARSRLRGSVADRYADEVKSRVGARAGSDPRLPDAEFVEALRPYGDDRADEVATVLSRARELAALRPSETALLDLARRAEHVEQIWQGGGKLSE